MGSRWTTTVFCYATLFCFARASAGRCSVGEKMNQKLKICNHKSKHLKSVSEAHLSRDCQVLDLSHNQLTEIEDFVFVHVSGIMFMDLSNNSIAVLHNHSFSTLTSLKCLDLSHNLLNLSYIAYPKSLFHPLQNLKVLDIGHNLISNSVNVYPDRTFGELASLEEITLDINDLVQFGQGFSRLTNLKRLSASSHSESYKLNKDLFISFENVSLEFLDLQWCAPRYIEELIFKPLQSLTALNVSNNLIGLRSVFKTLGPLKGGNLSVINFANVNPDSTELADQSITKELFAYIKDLCLKSLDLSDNLIVRFDVEALLELKHPECLEEVKLNHLFLPISWFGQASFIALRFRNIRVVEIAGSLLKKKLTHYPQMSTFGPARNITITVPPKLEIFNVSATRISCNHLQRRVFLEGINVLHTFNISYSEYFHCFNRKVINTFPSVRVFDMSGVNIEELNSDFFLSFPNCTHLLARETALGAVFENDALVFRELKHLQHLDISKCELTYIPQGLLLNQPELRSLDLSHNRLTALPAIVFSHGSFEKLDLRYNAIVSISDELRIGLDNFVRNNRGLYLLLEGNPLACNCYTYGFVEWIWKTNVTFDKNGNYTCALENGKFVGLLSLRDVIEDRKIACVSRFWIKFSAIGSSLLLFVMLVSVILYRYRVPIKYWYHAVVGGIKDNQPQARFRYDALVAYCHQDSDWVLGHLYPKLVSNMDGKGYKLCMYDKDFIPGVPIEDSIMAAINKSFKIIMVISPAFVRSVWCRFELQLARIKMVQEGREDVVIPVIREDVPVSIMPKSLLNLWNTSVFLIWSENPLDQRHFWENLIAALGPVRVGESDGPRHRHDETEMTAPCGERNWYRNGEIQEADGESARGIQTDAADNSVNGAGANPNRRQPVRNTHDDDDILVIHDTNITRRHQRNYDDHDDDDDVLLL